MSRRKDALAKAQEATCPECGELCSRPENLIKEWEATPKILKERPGIIRVWIHYWECPNCGHRFRTATRIWPKDRQAKTLGKTKLNKVRQKLFQRQFQGTRR